MNTLVRFLALVTMVGVSFAGGVGWQQWRSARDLYAIEPASFGWLRLAYDSITPPLHSTAMCADGWYTFARLTDHPCLGHGGTRMRTDHVFTGDEWEQWTRLRDSISQATIVGRIGRP